MHSYTPLIIVLVRKRLVSQTKSVS